jgi:beta-lactamase class D
MMKYFFLFLLFSFKLIYSQPAEEIREDLKEFFDIPGLKGSIVIYDSNAGKYIFYDKERSQKRFTPASTFKIFNSAAGIESGVINDTSYIFKWNGITHWNKNWNQDLNLRAAFQFSCVPCYQQLAKNIGDEKMKYFLEKENYGNTDISDGIDQFWLKGSLKISPLEQIEFLKNFYNKKSSFSGETVKIVKSIMLIEKNEKYKLFSKTGWGIIDEMNYGWFVGFIEQSGNVIFFALNVESKDPPKNFAQLRIDITKNSLKKLGYL